LADYFQKIFTNVSFTVASVEELILVKYFRNSFLATKVAFFNQIYDLCNTLDLDYNAVANGIGIDSRITLSHTDVTDQRGFGGHCFPKDTSALLHTAETFGYDLTILREAVEYNKKVRKE
jgi:Predicted UDP-glucose 6-dehydrogenase